MAMSSVEHLRSQVAAQGDLGTPDFEAGIQRLADLCQRVAEGFPSDIEARQQLARALSAESSLLLGCGGSTWMNALRTEAQRRAQAVLTAEAAFAAFPRTVTELREQLLALERVSKRSRRPDNSAP